MQYLSLVPSHRSTRPSLKTSVLGFQTFTNLWRMQSLFWDAARARGGGTGADWGKQNAKSTHVCNGYTEVIVQRDPLPSPLPLPPPPHHSIN